MEFRVLRGGLSRAAAVVALAAALATGSTGLLPVEEAHAAPAAEGTFGFSGDEGDYISLGQSYAYDTASEDRLNVYANADNSVVSLSVDGANGDWWSLNLAAPSGSALAPGTYAGATRHPFNEPSEPGLSLDGNGRGCNTLTGTFTIEEVEFGPLGYVKTLDATFEQHCEGDVAAARGEVHIDSPAPPAALDLGLAVALEGTASTLNGKATLHGSVSCNKPVRVDVAGDVTQVKKRKLIRGSYATVVTCVPGAPVAWSAKAVPTGDVPFQRGDVEVEARATAIDPDYDQSVSAAETVAVHLTRG
ncbi:hypothetical protein PV394_00305 [Streptomyces sp. NE06-03E]|uniref:Uncharacterized protein n=2 Tax=Streptomyces TaxID=1883 RepID=A0A652L8W9_9ACTN|nr:MULTISPECIES: hypothetical protein [unclassified Streptomyces]WSS65971.1 hypothetical protein OG284_34330 [Streptomyces sp. NBC_01177]WSS72967.1 hypothetical protein OG491_33925 [Streptomyces sp. NBC_01175]WSS80010.1 hypothetical protein OG414_34510 [Streptomyces sp. NBC_01174]MDX3053599.1 hypothetical protein [Streptomyces sp. NE06-03E]MDX3323437.1 hypothetical protein [Streptomyces sp. ME02-6979-3A]